PFCGAPGSPVPQNVVVIPAGQDPRGWSHRGPQPPRGSRRSNLASLAMRTGLLLINLGTPDAPTTPAVRRYLREFLGDPRVLDIGPVGRALLLHLIILPTRPAKSAHAYASIWDARRGSPLLYHSRDLAAAVAGQLGPARPVELPMRYRSPSLAAPLDPPPQAP